MVKNTFVSTRPHLREVSVNRWTEESFKQKLAICRLVCYQYYRRCHCLHTFLFSNRR